MGTSARRRLELIESAVSSNTDQVVNTWRHILQSLTGPELEALRDACDADHAGLCAQLRTYAESHPDQSSYARLVSFIREVLMKGAAPQ